VKTNELSSDKKTWRNPKCILVRERSQSEKAPSCLIPTIETVSAGGIGRREDEQAECRGFLGQ